MPRVTHLIRRNGIYWFKTDLPDDLAGRPLSEPAPSALRHLESPGRVGTLKTAIWLSLRTSLEREAKHRVGLEIARHAALFETARTFLTTGQLPPATQDIEATPSRVLFGPITDRPFAAASSQPSSRGVVGAASPVWMLSQAFDAWSSGGGARGTKRPAPNTITETKAALSRFIELHGDMSVSEIGKWHGREFRDAMARIPKGLPKTLRTLPTPELIKHDLSAYEPRSAITINKSLTLLGAVLGRAEQDGYFDGTGWRNPFNVAFDVDPADEDYYEPFSRDELNRLLASPVFALGQRPVRGRRDTAKWAPLLALMQGARRTEIIQLLVKDVVREDDTGIWTLRFDREGDKRIKTVSSIRKVPIHPKLLELGFLDFVGSRRELVGADASLWPGFEDRTKLAHRANKWSEWFNDYLSRQVVNDPLKKFHSFRGTFKRFGRGAAVDETIIDHLVGHANKSVGSRYGRKRGADGVRDSGYPIQRLLDEIGRMQFQGVHLDRIS